MHISALRRLPIALALLAVSLLVLSLASSNSTTALHGGSPSFGPTIDYKLCNDLPDAATFGGPAILGGDDGACVEDTTSGGNPDISFSFNIPAGDLNFAPDTFILTLGADPGYPVSTTDGFNITDGSTLAEGLAISADKNTISLGLTNGPCNNTTSPNFIWWNGDTNPANVTAVDPEGTSNRYNSIATDGGDAWAGKADADSPAVTGFPDITAKLFDPDGSGDATGGFSPVTPHARYVGLTEVPDGLDWQMLQLVIFKPGALATAFAANTPTNDTHPYTRLSSSVGWTMFVVLNDPQAVEGTIGFVNDFCSQVASLGMILGMVDTTGNGVGDTVNITSPSSGTGISGDGTFEGGTYLLSYRDRDQDGIQTDMDTCPMTPNTDDAYSSAGTDSDMLDAACDPDPNTNENTGDFDNDGYWNASDNCPQTANSLGADGGGPVFGPDNQKESENVTARNVGSPDGGPAADEMGDACDSEYGGGNSDTVADGLFMYGVDNDGICVPAGCTQSAGEATSVDWDADVTAGGGGGGTFTNYEEWFMQTDPLVACPNNTSQVAWPPDYDNNGTVNILDIVQWTPPAFGTSPPDPNYSQRKDLDANGTINILDIVVLTPPTFGTSC